MKVLKFIAPAILAVSLMACSSDAEGNHDESAEHTECAGDDKECCEGEEGECEGKDKASCEGKSGCEGEEMADHECTEACAEGCDHMEMANHECTEACAEGCEMGDEEAHVCTEACKDGGCEMMSTEA